MGKVIKAATAITILAVIGLVVYGYSVDMAPPPAPQSINVVLDAK